MLPINTTVVIQQSNVRTFLLLFSNQYVISTSFPSHLMTVLWADIHPVIRCPSRPSPPVLSLILFSPFIIDSKLAYNRKYREYVCICLYTDTEHVQVITKYCIPYYWNRFYYSVILPLNLVFGSVVVMHSFSPLTKSFIKLLNNGLQSYGPKLS